MRKLVSTMLLGGVLEFSWNLKGPLEGILPGSSQTGSFRAVGSAKAAGRGRRLGGLSLTTLSWLCLHW